MHGYHAPLEIALPIVGKIKVRCSKGHVFTTTWSPLGSFTAIRLGGACPGLGKRRDLGRAGRAQRGHGPRHDPLREAIGVALDQLPDSTM